MNKLLKIVALAAIVLLATFAMSNMHIEKLTVGGVWEEDGIPCASAGNWVLDGEFITGEEITLVYTDRGTDNVYDDRAIMAICSDGYYEIYDGGWMA